MQYEKRKWNKKKRKVFIIKHRFHCTELCYFAIINIVLNTALRFDICTYNLHANKKKRKQQQQQQQWQQ